MRVFRIEREKYLSTALSGIGASRSEGFRWNSQNTFLVYTSESRALALLEVSVHLDLSHDLPTDRVILEIEIPDNILILELDQEDLPGNWDSKPPSQLTQFIGDDFVAGKESAVLRVPSAIVPAEYNYLINPQHADASGIKIVASMPLQFDSRLKSSHS
jgi:RES domain-containing protein